MHRICHVLDEERKKLDDKAEKCVFLGVIEASKAYKLFNPPTKEVEINRDVFDEKNTWDWNRQQPTQVLYDDDDDAEQEQILVPFIYERSSSNTTQTATKTSPIVATVNEEAQSLHCIRRRPMQIKDYEVNGIDDLITHFTLFLDCNSITFESAIKEEKWQKGIDDEINAIERNDTWELSKLPKGHKIISVKWVFKTKLKDKVKLASTRQAWWLRDTSNHRGLIILKFFSRGKI